MGKDNEESDSSFILHPSSLPQDDSSFLLPPSSFHSTGLLGGSFDPPHIAHVLVAAWALACGEVESVWIIPTGGHPFGKALAPFEDRLEMCRRAFACFGARTEVLDVEREARVHYSIDTLRGLIARHPGRRWRWIMGSDTLEDAARWREFEELTRLASPLMVPRQGHAPSQAQATIGTGWTGGMGGTSGAAGTEKPGAAASFELPDLSSTFIRERLAAGRDADVTGLVPGPVLAWIHERGLYRKPS
jgi:nicotinate-nucleotide adenylyltransferase